MNKSRLIIISVTALIALAIIGFTAYRLSTVQTGPVSTGTALIGGPFTLVDGKGKTYTQKDFAGKYMLVYFGYTFCPDVCPAELQVMSAALEKLGPLADKIAPVFITIDPERDTKEVMAGYIENFGPRFTGLTGTPAQIAVAARAFKVYYSKAKSKDGEGGDDTYLMDHSSIVYFMGPDGKFLKHFAYGTPVEKMAAGIRKLVTR